MQSIWFEIKILTWKNNNFNRFHFLVWFIFFFWLPSREGFLFLVRTYEYVPGTGTYFKLVRVYFSCLWCVWNQVWLFLSVFRACFFNHGRSHTQRAKHIRKANKANTNTSSHLISSSGVCRPVHTGHNLLPKEGGLRITLVLVVIVHYHVNTEG